MEENHSHRSWETRDFMENGIFQDIVALSTPAGNISIRSGEQKIPFSVKKHTFNVPYAVCGADNKVLATLSTETNYDLVIATEQLETAVEYQLVFDGGTLKKNGGDEHTISLTGTFGGHAIGIGAYNPNEEEELAQAFAYSQKQGYLEQGVVRMPPVFDESKFRKYVVAASDGMDGYRFRLLERTENQISFSVAWIVNPGIDPAECETAIDFWIS